MTLAASPHDIRQDLERYLARLRDETFGMIDDLSDDDVQRQFDPIMSPLVWDVGHVGNFEEYWLLRELDGRAPHDAAYDAMYNPFDNPRWVRGDLPLLDRREATEYITEVRGDAIEILRRSDLDPDSPMLADGYVFRMVVQHEAQHQETMIQALNLRPDLAAYPPSAARVLPRPRSVDDTERVIVEGGPFLLGSADRSAAYDNERPRHEVALGAFGFDRFPVTNRRYAAFVAAGGYRREELWSEDGWTWRSSVTHEAPQGWVSTGDGDWMIRRLGHLLPLDPREPVSHVSYFEAEAFARYCGARLPTEAEWEKAASWSPVVGSPPRRYPWGDTRPTAHHANLDRGVWGPAPVGSYAAGASAYGVEQLLGDVYEWTASPFNAYPGFKQFPYPEYSEVFFGDPEFRVLRGASWATSRHVARNTFRNWDYRERRQIVSGIRLAWNV